MKRIKNEKGITLVALVVTIVVLIILAGISINLVLGDNGIMSIAQKAKENIELAKIEEETQLNELYTQLEIDDTGSSGTSYDAVAKITEFKTAIANAIEEAGGVKPDTMAETTVFANSIKEIAEVKNAKLIEFKTAITNAIKEAGGVAPSTTAETTVFANNIKGIVKEVTKDATATADNISAGKTAYVNGEKIIGTMPDVNSDLSYSRYLNEFTWNITNLKVGKTYLFTFSVRCKYTSVGHNLTNFTITGGNTVYSDVYQVSKNSYYTSYTYIEFTATSTNVVVYRNVSTESERFTEDIKASISPIKAF